jgi:hypothetical protein
VFAALFVAPLLAGLDAEAIGRRSGFLMLGMAVLLATPFIAAGTGAATRRPGAAAGPPNRADLMLVLAALPAAAMLFHRLPAGITEGGYLGATGAAAALAAFALMAPRLSTWIYGIVLLAAAAFLAYPPSGPLMSMFVPCIALGLGSGGLIKPMVADASRPWTAVGTACAAGLLLSGAVASLAIPFALIVAAGALAILAVDFLGRRSPAPLPV